jgi:hypothetical protein
MLRFISCQQATLLVEQKADAVLPQVEERRLALHLRYCPYCASYAQQSTLMNDLTRAAAQRRASQGVGLSAEAKERLQQRLLGIMPAAEKKNKK